MVNVDFYFFYLFFYVVKMYINIYIMYIDCRYFRIEIIKLDMKMVLLKKLIFIFREFINVIICIFILINVLLMFEYLVFFFFVISEL